MSEQKYVAVHESKDGYWTIASRPTTKKIAEAHKSSAPKNEVGKVVTLEEALAHKKVVGREYLEKFVRGGVNTKSTETCYISFLNKKKGFAEDKKTFEGADAWNDAVKWGRKNLENFNIDMIRSKYKSGGKTNSENWTVTASWDSENGSSAKEFLKELGVDIELLGIFGDYETFDSHEGKFLCRTYFARIIHGIPHPVEKGKMDWCGYVPYARLEELTREGTLVPNLISALPELRRIVA